MTFTFGNAPAPNGTVFDGSDLTLSSYLAGDVYRPIIIQVGGIYDDTHGGTHSLTDTSHSFITTPGIGALVTDAISYTAADDAHAYTWLHNYVWPIFSSSYPSYCDDFVPLLEGIVPPYPLGSADALSAGYGTSSASPMTTLETFDSNWYLEITLGTTSAAQFPVISYVNGSSSTVRMVYQPGGGTPGIYDGSNTLIQAVSGLEGSTHTLSIQLTTGTITLDGTYTFSPTDGWQGLNHVQVINYNDGSSAFQSWLIDPTFTFDAAPPNVFISGISDPCASTPPSPKTLTLRFDPWVQPEEVGGGVSSLHVYKNKKPLKSNQYTLSGNKLTISADAVPTSGDKITVKYFYDPVSVVDSGPDLVTLEKIQDLPTDFVGINGYQGYDLSILQNGEWNSTGEDQSYSGSIATYLRWNGTTFDISFSEPYTDVLGSIYTGVYSTDYRHTVCSNGYTFFCNTPTSYVDSSSGQTLYNFRDSYISITKPNSTGIVHRVSYTKVSDLVPYMNDPQVAVDAMGLSIYIFDAKYAADEQFNYHPTYPTPSPNRSAIVNPGPYDCAVFDFSTGTLKKVRDTTCPFLSTKQVSQQPGVLQEFENDFYFYNYGSYRYATGNWNATTGDILDQFSNEILWEGIYGVWDGNDVWSGPANLGGLVPNPNYTEIPVSDYNSVVTYNVVGNKVVSVDSYEIPQSVQINGITQYIDSTNLVAGDRSHAPCMLTTSLTGSPETYVYIPELNIAWDLNQSINFIYQFNKIYQKDSNIYLLKAHYDSSVSRYVTTIYKVKY